MGIFRKAACRACSHPERNAIDQQLRAGTSILEVGTRYGISKSAMHRHSQRHVVDGSSDESHLARKRLIDSTERALYRAEKKGDEKSVLDCLKLLATLQQQSRISAAAASPEQPEKNPQDLVQQLKGIYGLKDRLRPIQVRVIEDVPKMGDRKLVEQLRGLVARVVDTRPEVAAVATRLANLLLKVALDEETEREVAPLKAQEHGDGNSSDIVEEIAEEGEPRADERNRAGHDEGQPRRD